MIYFVFRAWFDFPFAFGFWGCLAFVSFALGLRLCCVMPFGVLVSDGLPFSHFGFGFSGLFCCNLCFADWVGVM